MGAEIIQMPEAAGATPSSGGDYWANKLSDIDRRLTAIEEQVAPIVDAANDIRKLVKFVKWSVPVLVGGLYSAGIISGPLGAAIKFMADHWPQ